MLWFDSEARMAVATSFAINVSVSSAERSTHDRNSGKL